MKKSLFAGSCAWFMLIIAAVCSPATVSRDAWADEASAYLAVESFAWKEFDGSGARLLGESGPLFGAGFIYVREFEDGTTLRPAGELFIGNVDYDGHACDLLTETCIPATSDVTYFGLNFTGDVGRRFGSGELYGEPFAGIGARTWVRDIDNGTTADGSLTAGYPEHWFTMNLRMGLRAAKRISGKKTISASAGIKLPLYNVSTAYISDIGYSDDTTVEPGRKTSFFAEAGFRANEFSATLFYDSLRFSKSNHDFAVYLPNGRQYVFWQPKSEMDIYGVRMGYSF